MNATTKLIGIGLFVTSLTLLGCGGMEAGSADLYATEALAQTGDAAVQVTVSNSGANAYIFSGVTPATFDTLIGPERQNQPLR